MRTTLSLDRYVYHRAKIFAKRNKTSMGKAVSKLIRDGINCNGAPIQYVNDFLVILKSKKYRAVTNEMVQDIKKSCVYDVPS